MAKAKNKRGVQPLSIHERFLAHIEATADARRYATEGIALANAGKTAAARAVARKAEAAHARMIELESDPLSGDRIHPLDR